MFSSLFSANAVFLYPQTNVLKILRSLGKSKESQKSSLISKEMVNKEMDLLFTLWPLASFFQRRQVPSPEQVSAWLPFQPG